MVGSTRPEYNGDKVGVGSETGVEESEAEGEGK